MAALVLFPRLISVRNLFTGQGYIAGETPGLLTVNGVAASREIEVRHRLTRIVVAVGWSAADGTYRFDGLDPNEEFDVIARDYTRTYKDVVEPAVKPEPY